MNIRTGPSRYRYTTGSSLQIVKLISIYNLITVNMEQEVLKQRNVTC